MTPLEKIERALDEGSLRFEWRGGHWWACKRKGKTRGKLKWAIPIKVGRSHAVTITHANATSLPLVFLGDVVKPAFNGTTVPLPKPRPRFLIESEAPELARKPRSIRGLILGGKEATQ